MPRTGELIDPYKSEKRYVSCYVAWQSTEDQRNFGQLFNADDNQYPDKSAWKDNGDRSA